MDIKLNVQCVFSTYDGDGPGGVSTVGRSLEYRAGYISAVGDVCVPLG